MISFAQSHFQMLLAKTLHRDTFQTMSVNFYLRLEFCSVSPNILFVSFVEGFELIVELMFY